MVNVQHLAVRVSDLERSVRFYVETFGGSVKLRPYVNDRQFTEYLFGVADTEYVIAYVELPDGFGIELFQFVPDHHPIIGVPQAQASFMHFAVAVDDVDACLARAVRAGGQSSGEPAGWAPGDPARYVYVKDPDGNVIELNDATWPRIIGSALELHPEARL